MAGSVDVRTELVDQPLALVVLQHRAQLLPLDRLALVEAEAGGGDEQLVLAHLGQLVEGVARVGEAALGLEQLHGMAVAARAHALVAQTGADLGQLEGDVGIARMGGELAREQLDRAFDLAGLEQMVEQLAGGGALAGGVAGAAQQLDQLGAGLEALLLLDHLDAAAGEFHRRAEVGAADGQAQGVMHRGRLVGISHLAQQLGQAQPGDEVVRPQGGESQQQALGVVGVASAAGEVGGAAQLVLRD